MGLVRWHALLGDTVSQFQAQYMWLLGVVLLCLAAVWSAGAAEA